jgi:hypothetical protein
MRRQKQTYFCLTVAILLGISAFAAAQDLHISFKPLDHIPDTAPAIEIGSVSHPYVLGVLHTGDDAASAVPQAPTPAPIQVVQEAQAAPRTDSSYYSLALGSAATVLAVVALTRSKSAHIVPVINVHVPASNRDKLRKASRTKKKASDEVRNKASHVYQNYDLGPSFEEERANEAEKAQQAEEALLMGLFESNMAMRSAIANLPAETNETPATDSPIAIATACTIANESSFSSSTTIPPADTTVTTS